MRKINYVLSKRIYLYLEDNGSSLLQQRTIYWCEQEKVLVDKNNTEVDWLNHDGIDCDWKNLWKVLEYYPYTTVTYVDYEKETSEFNFSIGDSNHRETRGLARLLYDVWFGYVKRKYKKHDNKTALKLQNRLTGQIIYMGWYDGNFTVTEHPAKLMDSWVNVVEINED